MSVGQNLELIQVFILAPKRFDHAHPRDVFIIGAGDLGVCTARSAKLDQDLLAELDGDDHQDQG